MKKKVRSLFGVIGLFLSSITFSNPTVTLTAPIINTTYPAGSNATVTYYISNYVPKQLSVVSISGVSSPLSITNHCATIPAGTPTHPGICSIDLTIAPTAAEANKAIKQQLKIYYGGRTPLSSNISFQITNMTNFTYVSTALNGILYQCAINSLGSLVSCSPTPIVNPGWFPTSAYFATFNDTVYAYVSSYYGDVFQCTLDNNNDLYSCTNINPTPPYYAPVAKNLTFATVSTRQYAYVSQANTGPGTDVWLCNTDPSSGVFTSCQTTGNDYVWSNVFDVTVATFDQQYAYVVDNNAAKIVRCTIDQTDGTFIAGSCANMTQTGTPWVSPSAVTFATFNGTRYAYISDQNVGVLQCNINQTTGDFLSCSSTNYSGGTDVFGVAFSAINDTTYAYISTLFGQVWVCATNNSGGFVGCTAQSPSFTDGRSFGNVFWSTFNTLQ